MRYDLLAAAMKLQTKLDDMGMRGTNEWLRMNAAFEAYDAKDYPRMESLIQSVKDTM